MKKSKLLKFLAVALFIFLAITGIYWHRTHLPLPSDVLHYQDIMRKISSDEEIQRLRWYVGNDTIRPYIGYDYRSGEEYVTHESLLSYLHAKVNYTKKQIIRHEDPIEILEYGKGRCGEFSIAFTALCLAYGCKARMVICLSDHVWCEVGFDDVVYDDNGWEFIVRWYHYDPTEQIFNDPYKYERDWGKKFDGVNDVVYAIEPDKITIVTDKYRYLPNVYIDIIEEMNMTVEEAKCEYKAYWFHFTNFTIFTIFSAKFTKIIFIDEQADKWVFWFPYDEIIQCKYYLEKES